jgi:AraC-like DNA-binding protein
MKQNQPKKLVYDHITNLRLESYEFVLAYAEELDNTTAEFLHQHPFYEIYYVLEEPIQIKVMDELIKCEKHELLIIAKNVEHKVLFEPDRNFHYFVCLWDLFPVISKSFRGPDGINEWEDLQKIMEQIDKRQFIHSTIPFEGYQVLHDIQDEWNNKQLAWNSSMCFQMFEFVIAALRHVMKAKIADKTLAGTLNYGIAASKFIHKHFEEPVTLKDIAKYLNISSRHVNRAYMRIFNTSIMRNLNIVRIEYAKRYLCFTDYSIEKIAEIVGFSCSRTLYKLFKQYVGVTLSQYRSKKQYSSTLLK